MKSDVSARQSLPTPRTDALVLDPIEPEQLPQIRAYVENHGGTWTELADGGSHILFPAGTLQWLSERNEHTETYTIQFPDTALFTWQKSGHISLSSGLPRVMTSRMSLPY